MKPNPLEDWCLVCGRPLAIEGVRRAGQPVCRPCARLAPRVGALSGTLGILASIAAGLALALGTAAGLGGAGQGWWAALLALLLWAVVRGLADIDGRLRRLVWIETVRCRDKISLDGRRSPA